MPSAKQWRRAACKFDENFMKKRSNWLFLGRFERFFMKFSSNLKIKILLLLLGNLQCPQQCQAVRHHRLLRALFPKCDDFWQ